MFVDEIPHGATGKMQKIKLREQFKDHVCRRPEGARRRPGDSAVRVVPEVVARSIR